MCSSLIYICVYIATPGDVEEASNELTPGKRAGLDNIHATRMLQTQSKFYHLHCARL